MLKIVWKMSSDKAVLVVNGNEVPPGKIPLRWDKETTLWSLGEDILVQRFIAESKGRDIRVLVIDGRARAAMRRIGREGEFRSNIHRGGTGEAVKLSRAYERIALRAAAAVGLRIAGVDILESSSGPIH